MWYVQSDSWFLILINWANFSCLKMLRVSYHVSHITNNSCHAISYHVIFHAPSWCLPPPAHITNSDAFQTIQNSETLITTLVNNNNVPRSDNLYYCCLIFRGVYCSIDCLIRIEQNSCLLLGQLVLCRQGKIVTAALRFWNFFQTKERWSKK